MRLSRLPGLMFVCALAALVGGSARVQAVGTIEVTSSALGGGVTQYRVVWTSDATGAVSGNAFGLTRGDIIVVEVVPNGGGTQPSNLYDITLVNANNIDILGGAGANLSNSAGAEFRLDPPHFFPGAAAAQTLDLVVANAGNAKGGTVWIRVRE